MTEEWNLKGRDYDNNSGFGISDKLYHEEIIETLRKKLIEIIKVHIGEEIDYADPNDIIEEINKLFGVQSNVKKTEE